MAIVLRPYQKEMIADVYTAWRDAKKNVLLVCPTGGGKTQCFVSIAVDMAVNSLFGTKYPTAISVHRKELVQQISLTLCERGVNHNIIAPSNVIKGIVAAQRRLFGRQFYDYNASITVISVDTLNARIAKHEKWAKTIKLWIIDEAAHVLKDNKWGRVVEYFPNALGLGVTATPKRLDKKGLGSDTDGVFDVMVEGPPTRWMIDNGYLSKYKVVIPVSDYRNFLKETKGNSDYSSAAMAAASEQSQIVGDVVKNYGIFVPGKQAIVFCSDIASANRMEKAFLDAGIKAKLLTGETEDNVRLNTLIDFRDKKLQVLLNVDLFDEGLDVPSVEAVIMARPTKSLGKFLQCVGRGLRIADNKQHLILIDHVGNVKFHGLPDSRRLWSLDRSARIKHATNLLRFCTNVMCNAPFDRFLTKCPYCGQEDTRQSGEGSGRVGPMQVDGDLMLIDPEVLRELEILTQLESPASVANRVSKAAGGAAALHAMKNQVERIETQKLLVDAIANWAGKLRSELNLNDRELHKYYYITFNETIAESLAKPKAEMLARLSSLEGGEENA